MDGPAHDRARASSPSVAGPSPSPSGAARGGRSSPGLAGRVRARSPSAGSDAEERDEGRQQRRRRRTVLDRDAAAELEPIESILQLLGIDASGRAGAAATAARAVRRLRGTWGGAFDPHVWEQCSAPDRSHIRSLFRDALGAFCDVFLPGGREMASYLFQNDHDVFSVDAGLYDADARAHAAVYERAVAVLARYINHYSYTERRVAAAILAGLPDGFDISPAAVRARSALRLPVDGNGLGFSASWRRSGRSDWAFLSTPVGDGASSAARLEDLHISRSRKISDDVIHELVNWLLSPDSGNVRLLNTKPRVLKADFLAAPVWFPRLLRVGGRVQEITNRYLELTSDRFTMVAGKRVHECPGETTVKAIVSMLTCEDTARSTGTDECFFRYGIRSFDVMSAVVDSLLDHGLEPGVHAELKQRLSLTKKFISSDYRRHHVSLERAPESLAQSTFCPLHAAKFAVWAPPSVAHSVPVPEAVSANAVETCVPCLSALLTPAKIEAAVDAVAGAVDNADDEVEAPAPAEEEREPEQQRLEVESEPEQQRLEEEREPEEEHPRADGGAVERARLPDGYVVHAKRLLRESAEGLRRVLAHRVRSEIQQERSNSGLAWLCAAEAGARALLVIDFKTKFDPRKNKETSQDIYAKAGLVWLGGALIVLKNGAQVPPGLDLASGGMWLSAALGEHSDIFQCIYIDVPVEGPTVQNATLSLVATGAMLQAVRDMPEFEDVLREVQIQCDNAPNFTASEFVLGIPLIGLMVNLRIVALFHTEANDGKSLLDAHFGVASMELARYLDLYGTSIVTPAQLAAAIAQCDIPNAAYVLLETSVDAMRRLFPEHMFEADKRDVPWPKFARGIEYAFVQLGDPAAEVDGARLASVSFFRHGALAEGGRAVVDLPAVPGPVDAAAGAVRRPLPALATFCSTRAVAALRREGRPDCSADGARRPWQLADFVDHCITVTGRARRFLVPSGRHEARVRRAARQPARAAAGAAGAMDDRDCADEEGGAGEEQLSQHDGEVEAGGDAGGEEEEQEEDDDADEGRLDAEDVQGQLEPDGDGGVDGQGAGAGRGASAGPVRAGGCNYDDQTVLARAVRFAVATIEGRWVLNGDCYMSRAEADEASAADAAGAGQPDSALFHFMREHFPAGWADHRSFGTDDHGDFLSVMRGIITQRLSEGGECPRAHQLLAMCEEATRFSTAASDHCPAGRRGLPAVGPLGFKSVSSVSTDSATIEKDVRKQLKAARRAAGARGRDGAAAGAAGGGNAAPGAALQPPSKTAKAAEWAAFAGSLGISVDRRGGRKLTKPETQAAVSMELAARKRRGCGRGDVGSTNGSSPTD